MKCSLGIYHFLQEISSLSHSNVFLYFFFFCIILLESLSYISFLFFGTLHSDVYIFHAKMDTIKGRNGMDLTEAEDIKKRWQEYTEELYKKDLTNPDNHDSVITHLEPDILECKVKWALRRITPNKASGDDEIPAELFQILKDDAVKVLHSVCQ